MSGIQEILVLIIIVLGILILPRILNPDRSEKGPQGGDGSSRISPGLTALSGRMRLAIIVSILWPLAALLYFQPWHRHLIPFVVFGIGPVALFWGAFWVVAGFRKPGR